MIRYGPKYIGGVNRSERSVNDRSSEKSPDTKLHQSISRDGFEHVTPLINRRFPEYNFRMVHYTTSRRDELNSLKTKNKKMHIDVILRLSHTQTQIIV